MTTSGAGQRAAGGRLRRLLSSGVFVTCGSVLVAGIATSAWLARLQQQDNKAAASRRLEARADLLVRDVLDRLKLYEYGLHSVRGLVTSYGPDRLEREAFRRFEEARFSEETFPGARGFGFIRRVRPNELDAFIDLARRNNGQDFAVRTLGADGGERYIIQFIEPSTKNAGAEGLDVGSEARRRAAAEHSIVTGQVAITAPITLVQATGKPNSGFLVMLPVLQKTGSVESEVVGWAYTPLVADEVLSTVHIDRQDVDVSIADVADEGTPFLRARGSEPVGRYPEVRRVQRVFDRDWVFVVRATPAFMGELKLFPPTALFFAGAFVSMLLAMLAGAVMTSDRRSRQIREQREHLARIVDTSSDAIVSEALDGRVTGWNAAAERLFGFTAEEALGRRLGELILPADREAEDRFLLEQARQGQPVDDYETTRFHRDGSGVDVSISSSPVRDDQGRVIGMAKSLRDVSRRVHERRELELFKQQLETQVAERTDDLDRARHTLQTILDALPSLIGYVDRSLEVAFANRALARWMKADGGWVVGSRLGDLVDADPASPDAMHLREALDGKVVRYEKTVHSPHVPGVTHVLIHLLPDTVAGTVRGLYLLIHDVTELTSSRQRLADALRENEALLQTIRQHAIYSVTDTSGAIIDANDNFCQISGYRLDELVGRNHRMVSSGRHDAAFWLALWARISAGEVWQGDICNRAKNGDLYWVSTVIAPFFDAQGRIERYVSIRTDVTARERSAQALRLERERLSNILWATNVGTWEWNAVSGEYRADPRWAAMLGRIDGALDMSMDAVVALIHPDDQGDRARTLAAHLAGEQDRYEFECRVRTPAGDWVWVMERGRVVTRLPDGRAEWVYGTTEDISARRMVQETLHRAMADARAASVAKSEFLANISHEIRTPMNAVIGLSYLLRKTELDAEQLELLGKMDIASRSLLGVINDVLDLSKIEAGEMSIEDAPFDPTALLRDLHGMLSVQAAAKGLDMTLSGTDSLPKALLGDAMRLRQILLNLLSNAIKFTDAGSVDLSAHCTVTGDTARVMLSVRDTGIGIDKQQMSRLFKPFTQADASTSRRFGGTGLGLSIVQRLASLMGGTVRVDSVPDRGSTFTLDMSFPLVAEPAGGPGPADALSVFITDDDADQRRDLLLMARALGWRVETFESGTQMVTRVIERLAANQGVDCLIVDWLMPGMDGLQTLAFLADRLGMKKLPAAIIVSMFDVRRISSEPNAGLADSILTKPVTPPALFNAVNQAVVRHGGAFEHVFARSRQVHGALECLPGVRVMVVDDSDINLEVAHRILEEEGAVVTTCTQGAEALERLVAAPDAFDCVLMDLQMPVMDGHEAARRIRATPTLLGLPVIALTASVLEAERTRSQESGMDDFIVKPLDPPELVRAIRRHVERRQGTPLEVRGKDAGDAAPAGWPLIDGIDVADAARRLGRDVGLFHLLLGRMLDEFGSLQADRELFTADDARRHEVAARMHKLRGSSGMLGAKDVQRHAGEIEDALRAGGTATARGLIDAQHGLVEALAALREQYAALQRATDGPVAGAVAVAAGGTPSLSAFADLLANQRFEALAQFPQVRPDLAGLFEPSVLARMERAVEALAFEEALALLREKGIEAPGARR